MFTGTTSLSDTNKAMLQTAFAKYENWNTDWSSFIGNTPLTDVNFQSLDQFEIRSRRMPHIVPDSGALMVTGVTPEQLESATDTHYSFAPKIREKLLSWSPAIF